MTLTREMAVPYVSYVVDDAGCGRAVGADQHAIVRAGNPSKRIDDPNAAPCYPSVLVGWQCGFEPMFVAVHSYLDVRLNDDEAAVIAINYLDDLGWFNDKVERDSTEPDYILR